RIDAVLVEEIDAVRSYTLQRGVRDGANALGPAVPPLRDDALDETELRRDDGAVSHRCERLADDLFVHEGTVGFRRVEERDAALERGANEGDRVDFVRRRTEPEAETHA